MNTVKHLAGLMALVFLISCGGGGGGGGSSAPSSTDSTSTTQVEVLSIPHFGDGTYVVGKDIQPGTYRTRTAMPSCYYERLSGFGGTSDEIIANNFTSNPAVIAIAASDKGFTSSRCGTWTQDLSAITTSQTTFGDGIFIVGTDIQAGTYRSTGTGNCYWARLSDFAGQDNIIANDYGNASSIVTIATSDAGFESSNCLSWTRI